MSFHSFQFVTFPQPHNHNPFQSACGWAYGCTIHTTPAMAKVMAITFPKEMCEASDSLRGLDFRCDGRRRFWRKVGHYFGPKIKISGGPVFPICTWDQFFPVSVSRMGSFAKLGWRWDASKPCLGSAPLLQNDQLKVWFSNIRVKAKMNMERITHEKQQTTPSNHLILVGGVWCLISITRTSLQLTPHSTQFSSASWALEPVATCAAATTCGLWKAEAESWATQLGVGSTQYDMCHIQCPEKAELLGFGCLPLVWPIEKKTVSTHAK